MQEEHRDYRFGDPRHSNTQKALQERTNTTTLSPYLVEPRAEVREPEEDELNILDLWRVVAKRKWTVIAFFMILVVAAVTATYLMTPLYQASLTLQIERESTKVIEEGSILPSEGGSSLDFYQTQYELLRSRSLAKRVIDQLRLHEHPLFSTPPKPPLWQPLVDWMKAFASQADTPAPQTPFELDLVPVFLDSLIVEPIRNSRLVKVHFISPDPELAAQVVNTLGDIYINMNLERRFDAAAYAKDFLQEKLAQTKGRLEESERKLVEFARQQEIVNVDDRQTVTNQQLQQATAALTRAEEQRIQAEAIYRQMQRQGGQGLSQILESPVIQQFKAMKAELEGEYQENLKLYKPAYPKMRQLQGQIDEVGNKINAEIGNIRASIQGDYEAARANEELLRAKVEQIKGEVMGLQNRSIDYNIYKREVDTNRQLYEGLLQRYKEVGVAGGVGSNNLSIIDRAEIPLFPFKPNLKINVLLAMALGLIGGIGLAFLFEHLDDTIKQPEEIERIIGIPVLGIIPSVKEARSRDRQGKAVALENQDNPRSPFAEAYRSVRTALQFSTPEGPPHILAVTSSVASEGKTTTSLSLAIQFAQAGKSVLLIDADLRNPSLHHALNIENQLGLTNYLAAGAAAEDIAKDCSQIPHLSAITSGPLPPNPAELLSTPKMMSLLEEAAKQYDQIVIDCPPVLGLADALILGHMAEAALLVVEAGNTRRGYVQGSLKRLRSSRTRVLGGILTKLDAQIDAYGNRYYYYSYSEGSQLAGKRLTAAER